ncbi:MAG: hypothetical protein AAF745_06635, partial [Planctomycetota bacterium]
TLYYANHQTYASNLNRAVLPVDPSWLMQAIGLPRLDPASVLAGPVVRGDGMIEVRTAEPTAAGTFQRVMLVEPNAGYVTHLFLYDPNQRLVAKSVASKHQFYDTVNVVLPHAVDVALYPAAGPPMEMSLEISNYSINQLLTDDPGLFVLPATPRRIDLTTLTAAAPVTAYRDSGSIGTRLR